MQMAMLQIIFKSVFKTFEQKRKEKVINAHHSLIRELPSKSPVH